MFKFNTTLHTNGRGYWSNKARAVETTKLVLAYTNDELDFGELRVYFNTDTWDTDKHGLIYTDKQFARELNAFLLTQGLATADYSEQGMQGDNYVSLDVEGDFLQAWDAKFSLFA